MQRSHAATLLVRRLWLAPAAAASALHAAVQQTGPLFPAAAQQPHHAAATSNAQQQQHSSSSWLRGLPSRLWAAQLLHLWPRGARYRGASFLAPSTYWLRQLGWGGHNVTPALVAANLGCYGLQLIAPGFTRACVRVAALIDQGEYWRLLTAAFVHANALHAGVNMLAVWNLGRALEASLGSSTFLAVYLGSAIAGNTAGWLLDHGMIASLGSSSALYGCFGALLLTKWRQRAYLHRDEIISLAQTVGLNLLLVTAFAGSVDHVAHAGGFFGGVLLTALLTRRRGAAPYRRW